MDLSVQMNVLLVSGEIRGAETADIPTAFGGASDVVFQGEVLVREFEFHAIDGVGRNILPHPVLQASVGVPFGTELFIRFFPRTTIENIKFSTYSLGLKHNLNQHFFYPKPRDTQFAALVAFSRYDVNYSFTPVLIEYELWQGETELLLEMQDMEVGADLWLFQLITSKSFLDSDLEIFGAAGLTTSTFNYFVGGGGLALNEMNAGLQTLNDDDMVVKVDLGVAFEAGRFLLSSMITVGTFSNVNLGVHYRL